jgi:integrase
MKRRHERPLRRVNPSGKVVYVARWTDKHGKRTSAGTFDLRREAQDAIDAAYERDANPGPDGLETVGGYASRWTDRHPRTDRTNASYGYRIASVLDVKLRGRAFRDWDLSDVTPREAVDLIDFMLREQGRAAAGALGVLSTLSAMWKDATKDGLVIYNPFRDATVRASDPRIVKPPRRLRLYTWEQMHAVAAKAPGVYGPAMVRTLSDCGLRLGEMLALERGDLRLNGCADPECRVGDYPHLHVVRTAYQGRVTPGTKTTRGRAGAGRAAPVGPVLADLLRALPPRLDTRLLFPAPRGRVWQNRSFYKEIWYVARATVDGMEHATPHEFRHAWVSRMRAAAIDVADVADAAGHTVETATAKYTHPLGDSFKAMGEAVGE